MMTDSISIYWPSLITLHCSSGKPGYIMCPETMVMAASCLCVLRRISHLHFLMKIFYQRFKMWQQQWQKSQICTQKNKPLKSDVHGKREQSQCKGADGGGGGGGVRQTAVDGRRGMGAPQDAVADRLSEPGWLLGDGSRDLRGSEELCPSFHCCWHHPRQP